MSDTYTKLFASITASTIVSEPLATRWLWVTFLAMADASGCVYGSIPGVARIANITVPECEQAIQCFLSPDPYSRTKEHDGRRVEAIDGGWRLLNFAKYAAIRNAEERKEYMREYMRKRREHVNNEVNSGKQKLAELAGLAPQAPTQTKEEQEPRAGDGGDKPEPTAAGLACAAIMKAGLMPNPSHPDLLAAIAEGTTVKEFADAAAECKAKGKGFPYMLAMVRRRRAECAAPKKARDPPKPSAHQVVIPKREHISDEQREANKKRLANILAEGLGVGT